MKVVCIKSTTSAQIFTTGASRSEFTVGKIYTIAEIITNENIINIYTKQPIKRYHFQNDNGVMCAWSHGPGNGTTLIEFAKHFCDIRTFNLNQLEV